MCKKLKAFFALLIAIAPAVRAQTGLTGAINTLLTPQIKNDEPGGVVLVAKNGQVIYKKPFGMADMELGVPVNDSMIFYIGSNTKQFTAIAILQLVEQGKIQLQDTIGKFIDSCPYPASSITIQQLLSHTSGLGSNYETASATLRNQAGATPAGLAKYVAQLPMDFSPGTKWDYNNANFYVLGWLVEKLSGKSYAGYVTENIFARAGMYNTYMQKELSIIKNRPHGYKNDKTGDIQPVNNINTGTTTYAAGGIQSTAADLLKWNRALLAGKIVKPATLTAAFTPQKLLNGEPVKYGLGWHLEELHGSPTVRHGGLVPGFTAETLYLPKEDVFVIILLNAGISKIPIIALSRIIAGLAIGKPYIFNEVAFDKSILKNFVGVYTNTHKEQINITEDNGQLCFQRPGGHLYVLHYAGNNEFFMDKDFLRVQFTTGAAGSIKSLQLSKVDIGMTEWFKD